MTDDKTAFIHLLSCFLNNKTPNALPINWSEMYSLADKHDVQGIIARMSRLLPADLQPDGEIKAYLNQHIGFAVQDYEIKKSSMAELVDMLCDNNIDHIFVKGFLIRRHYPLPELRSSGDIDIIVRADEYDNAVSAIKPLVPDNRYTKDVFYFNLSGTKVEMHSSADVETHYFDNIFDIAKQKEKNTYELNEYDHLLYVLCHLCHHIRYRGAGIRMLMDIDALVRSINGFDEVYFESLCRNSGYIKSWHIISSLAKMWFDTPVVGLYAPLDDKTLASFERVMLDGGVFGFDNGSLGDYYLSGSVNAEGQIGFKARLRALRRLFFPSKSAVINSYTYASKCALLLPVAYFNRLFDAVFKRFSHSKSTINSILGGDSDYSAVQAELMHELNLK